MTREEEGKRDIVVTQPKVTCGRGQTSEGGGEHAPARMERAAAQGQDSTLLEGQVFLNWGAWGTREANLFPSFPVTDPRAKWLSLTLGFERRAF